MRTTVLASLLVSATLIACAVEAAEDGADDVALTDGKADGGLAEGSPTARAVLTLVGQATKATLTGDVGLTARTAGNIVTARTRAPFTTLAALDAVPYVGPVAFAKLVAYVEEHDLVEADANPLTATAARVPWSGYWWSMQNAELALGWDDGAGRAEWTEGQARAFDACLPSYTASCTQLIGTMAGAHGERLAPLMKFDYQVRRQLEAAYGAGAAPASMYAHATKWELDHHYLGDNTAHRYWDSRGYAGKCIGWALATFDFDEPTTTKTLDGVVWKPADIKGLLAAIYNGAQFFIPADQTVGEAFHDVPGSDSQAYYDDVRPDDFVRALFATIGQGRLLEADLDPGDGVWNYPIHRYALTIVSRGSRSVTVEATLGYANDEVDIDLVSTANPARPDLLARSLRFELTFPSAVGAGAVDLASATGGRWLGDSVDTHPDALILGVEAGWRTTIYDYRNTSMNTEVNFALLKRAQNGSGAWVPLVDDVLARYYAR